MRQHEAENIHHVKLALADKYRRKARTTSSKPRKLALFRLADRYQRQADAANPNAAHP